MCLLLYTYLIGDGVLSRYHTCYQLRETVEISLQIVDKVERRVDGGGDEFLAESSGQIQSVLHIILLFPYVNYFLLSEGVAENAVEAFSEFHKVQQTLFNFVVDLSRVLHIQIERDDVGGSRHATILHFSHLSFDELVGQCVSLCTESHHVFECIEIGGVVYFESVFE